MDSLLRFPFKKPRVGQLEIAQNVYNALKENEWLIIEAPNGAGKTAAILSGAFKAIEDFDYRIIFLTRTRKQVEHVYEEALKFKEVYPRVSFSPTLSYKDGCHFYGISNQELIDEALSLFCRVSVKTFSCPFYNNSFHKIIINVPLSELISLSKRRRFCPIEVLRTTNYSSDMIFTSFITFFDLKSRYPFIWNNKRVAIIIDEAHNFPKFLTNRGIRIAENEMERLYVLFNRLSIRDLALFVSSLRLWCLKHRRGIEMRVEPFVSTSGIKENLFRMIEVFQYTFNDFYNFLTIEESLLVIKLLLVLEFIKEHINSESSFVRLQNEEGEFVLELLEFDPEIVFKRYLKDLRRMSLIFSSATYFSISSFMEELGIIGSRVVEIKTDPLNRKCITIIDPTISTERRERGDFLFLQIANKIIEIYRTHNLPFPVFFTSYSMLKNVFKKIPTNYLSKIIVEKEDEKVEEGEKKICEMVEKSKMLFAVLGGKYSEGIDFPNKKIGLVVIVGLPFPPPSYKLKRSIEEKKRKRGWRYAFLTEMLIPAVSKVVQASGRIFRRYGKSGVVYLLDRRFLRKDVYSIIPFWLKENVIISPAEFVFLRKFSISSFLP